MQTHDKQHLTITAFVLGAAMFAAVHAQQPSAHTLTGQDYGEIQQLYGLYRMGAVVHA